jgi:hypothetical protein
MTIFYCKCMRSLTSHQAESGHMALHEIKLGCLGCISVGLHGSLVFLIYTLLYRCWAACFPLFFHGHMGQEVSSSYKPTRYLSKDMAWLKGNYCHDRKDIMTSGWTLVQHMARLDYHIKKLLLPICSHPSEREEERSEEKKERKKRKEERRKEREKRKKEEKKKGRRERRKKNRRTSR